MVCCSPDPRRVGMSLSLDHFGNLVHGLSKAWPRRRSGSPVSVASVHVASPSTALRCSASSDNGLLIAGQLQRSANGELGMSSVLPLVRFASPLDLSGALLVLGYSDAPPVHCAVLGWLAAPALGSSGVFDEIRRVLFIFICCSCC